MIKTDSGMREVNYVSLCQRRVFRAELFWQQGRITEIRETGGEHARLGYLIPGFIDAHVHIESTMLMPAEFARIALRHGTLSVVSDPHEIANVLGVDGVQFMLENARKSPFKAFFGAPSCVPATPFETANGALGCAEIETLLNQPEVCCLSEMMNYPGVLSRDSEVISKIALARRLGYPVDGHAPGLVGDQATAYVNAGISTDHECFSMQEARDKIGAGMWVLIREGSAARNLDTLHPLISEFPGQVMLCSDDKHPDDLLKGHINEMAARAVAEGHSPFDVLRCACINPIAHYRLPVGQLRVGDPMDAVEVADLDRFKMSRVWLDGELVAREGEVLLPRVPVTPINVFKAHRIAPEDLAVASAGKPIRVICVQDGSLVTREKIFKPKTSMGVVTADLERDILQICVVNRYHASPPAVAFISGFGLKRGAIASSVAHDSHNIVALGADSESICRVVNALIEHKGGIALSSGDELEILPLPVAGIMSDDEGDRVGRAYAHLDEGARGLGSGLSAPYMTLSFMALLVIPELKLSDRGLFDGRRFEFVDLAV